MVFRFLIDPMHPSFLYCFNSGQKISFDISKNVCQLGRKIYINIRLFMFVCVSSPLFLSVYTRTSIPPSIHLSIYLSIDRSILHYFYSLVTPSTSVSTMSYTNFFSQVWVTVVVFQTMVSFIAKEFPVHQTGFVKNYVK